LESRLRRGRCDNGGRRNFVVGILEILFVTLEAFGSKQQQREAPDSCGVVVYVKRYRKALAAIL